MRSKSDKLKRCRSDFESTGNPLYAWEAWGLIRFTWRSQLHESLELPEWLGEYLDACGRRLLGVPMEEVSRKPYFHGAEGSLELKIDIVKRRPAVSAETGEGAGAIGRALKFPDGLALARKRWGGPFDARENGAARVVDLMWSERISLDAAAERLELTNGWPERRTIRRWVEGASRGALRRMQDRLREATGAVPERGDLIRAYSVFCRQRNLTK